MEIDLQYLKFTWKPLTRLVRRYFATKKISGCNNISLLLKIHPDRVRDKIFKKSHIFNKYWKLNQEELQTFLEKNLQIISTYKQMCIRYI